MIVLGLDGAEEFAEAYYVAETAAAAAALGQPPRGNLWQKLDPEMRAIKVAATARFIAQYRVEGMTLSGSAQ
jgi:hypothetical protein